MKMTAMAMAAYLGLEAKSAQLARLNGVKAAARKPAWPRSCWLARQ